MFVLINIKYIPVNSGNMSLSENLATSVVFRKLTQTMDTFLHYHKTPTYELDDLLIG